jgi:lipopolysaccharide biosynthesis glycosyltransferase
MTVPIVFCIHDPNGQYWPNLAVAIESVLVNSSGQHAIHVLHNETMTQEAKETIQLIASIHGAKLHLTSIKLTEFLE